MNTVLIIRKANEVRSHYHGSPKWQDAYNELVRLYRQDQHTEPTDANLWNWVIDIECS